MNRITRRVLCALLMGMVGMQATTAQTNLTQSSLLQPTTSNANALSGGALNPSSSEIKAQILHFDAFSNWEMKPQAGQRSVPLAFVLSAVVPGAGQFYNKQYVKAGIAVALEAAVITGYTMLRTKGLDAETDFQNVAHQNWSPNRYATWLNDYSDYLSSELGAVITAPKIQVVNSVDFTNPSGWSSADQAAVNTLFSQIRAIERQVYHPETGAAFSHQIPDFSAQQYYELIGKYFQFAPGWDDYGNWKDDQGRFTAAIDPEMTGTNGSKPNVSSSFYAYAEEHADAQDMLREASRISLLFIFNHLIAAVDAAVSAKLFNNKVESQMGLAYNSFGAPTPVATIRIQF